MTKIKANERLAIIQSLRSGQTPRTGLTHLQVGRLREIEQLAGALSAVAQGGATMRFIIGDYGAGKTFFLNLVKHTALQKGFVVVHADVHNDRRLHGAAGQSVALYNELMRNMATRTRPEGSALKSVIERFIQAAVEEAEATELPTRDVIRKRLEGLQELVSGYGFADVLSAYYEGYEAQDDARQQAALRWLRGEFASKVDARKALDVRNIVDDESMYDFLKLWSQFVVLAGFKGLLVQFDEMMSIYQLTSSHARSQNYEQILRIFNDVNQGSAEYLAIMMGGTPEFLEDARRGLYSHEALRTRLAPNSFADSRLVDYKHPVVRLSQLTREELRSLLDKVVAVFGEGPHGKPLITSEGVEHFIARRFNKVGDASFRTPRETIKEFADLLAILEQHPEENWQSLLEDKPFAATASEPKSRKDKDTAHAGLENFRL